MKRLVKIRVAVLSVFLSTLLLPPQVTAIREDLNSPLASHLNKQYTDDLDGLLEKRYIRVLTTFNKTNFYIAGGKFYGFEYSLLKEYEKKLRKRVKRRDLKVVVEFIPLPRDQLIPALVSGYGDIAAAGLTITPDRLKQVDFTDPYLKGINEVIVVNRSMKPFKDLDALSGQDIFVRKSSSYYESLQELNIQFKKKKLAPVRIIEADENLETEDILELVHSGAISITVADSHIADIWARVLDGIKVLNNIKVRSGSRIAWMVRKDNPLLKGSLSKFIKRHRKGTFLGNIYFNRYYKKTKWIANPLSGKDRKKLDQYKALIRKYSDRYGLDWMLILALAYQESGLNNSKKSSAGAVGIMQIRPATAADRNVAIQNVHLLENNIHAGIKYLAFLRDRYFSDATMREKDHTRFALAAYNAGPAKIMKVRNKAKKMGLDPDKWFRHTELAALKHIGQETVRYVSNINKYYLVFKFVFETDKVRKSEKEKVRSR